jgi:histidyl-tRNA synthetase
MSMCISILWDARSAGRPLKTVMAAYLSEISHQLCSDCSRRRDRNPLRVLDCKVPSCRDALADAPHLLDYLCDDCRAHFGTVKQSLTDLEIAYVIDKRLVRGLDYYTRTTFEIQTGSLGAQSAVAGGGRYDGLVNALGGPQQPAIGFAIGLDRLAAIAGICAEKKYPDLYVAALGEKSKSIAFAWVCKLNAQGIYCEMDFDNRSLKSQMKRAHKLGTGHVAIVGENELDNGAVILRDMLSKMQTEIPLASFMAKIKTAIER